MESPNKRAAAFGDAAVRAAAQAVAGKDAPDVLMEEAGGSPGRAETDDFVPPSASTPVARRTRGSRKRDLSTAGKERVSQSTPGSGRRHRPRRKCVQKRLEGKFADAGQSPKPQPKKRPPTAAVLKARLMAKQAAEASEGALFHPGRGVGGAGGRTRAAGRKKRRGGRSKTAPPSTSAAGRSGRGGRKAGGKARGVPASGRKRGGAKPFQGGASAVKRYVPLTPQA